MKTEFVIKSIILLFLLTAGFCVLEAFYLWYFVKELFNQLFFLFIVLFITSQWIKCRKRIEMNRITSFTLCVMLAGLISEGTICLIDACNDFFIKKLGYELNTPYEKVFSRMMEGHNQVIAGYYFFTLGSLTIVFSLFLIWFTQTKETS